MRPRCQPGCFCTRCTYLNRSAAPRPAAPVRVRRTPTVRPGSHRTIGAVRVSARMREAILEALSEGQAVASIARSCGHDRKTVMAVRSAAGLVRPGDAEPETVAFAQYQRVLAENAELRAAAKAAAWLADLVKESV